MGSDFQLLREYLEHGDEKAFACLIERHLNLVFSTAARITRSEAAAEDIAQITFARLAWKAKTLRQDSHLPGWLHTEARFAALQWLRQERRRMTREQVHAPLLGRNNQQPSWTEVAPVLDEAIARLEEADRQAVILRFLQGLSLREVGEALSLSEDAARMRVNRSLEKLRALLRQHGIESSAAGLTTLLGAHAIAAAPSTLAHVTLTAVTVSAPAAAVTASLPLLLMTKTKIAVTGVALIGTLTTVTLLQHSENERLRGTTNALSQSLDRERAETDRRFSDLQAELNALKASQLIVGERRASTPPPLSVQPATRSAAPQTQQRPSAVSAPMHDQVAALLAKPPAEQAAYFATSRRQVLNRDFSDPDGLFKARELAAHIRPALDQLERSPADFAAFQASYITETIQLDGEEKRNKIREIIHSTYEQAVAQKLDAPSRPPGETEAEAWALQRDALDRAGTKAVQALLTPEERALFDRAFLGIVGIDLGIGDGAAHRFVENNGQTIVFPSEEARPPQ